MCGHISKVCPLQPRPSPFTTFCASTATTPREDGGLLGKVGGWGEADTNPEPRRREGRDGAAGTSRETNLDDGGGGAVQDDERSGRCKPDARDTGEVIAASEDAELPYLCVRQSPQRVLRPPPAVFADAFEQHLVAIAILVHLVQHAVASEDDEIGILSGKSSGQPQRPG